MKISQTIQKFKIRKQIEITLKESYPILFFSAINSLLFNFMLYYSWTNQNFNRSIFFSIASSLIFTPFLYIASWKAIFLKFFISIIFFLQAIAVYFVLIYKIDLNPDTFALLFETDIAEASAFISLDLIIFSTISIVFGLILANYLLKTTKNNKTFGLKAKSITLIILFLLLAGAQKLIFAYGIRLPNPLPQALASNSVNYFKEKYYIKTVLKNKMDLSKTPSKLDETSRDLTVVLVIGESARSDHFSINGYSKNTNKNLSKLDLISFKDTISCSSMTRISVPCMLTRNTVNDHSNLVKETSFITLFKKHNFHTAWISNQRALHKHDSTTTSIANEADFIYFNRSSYMRAKDSDLLPKIDEILSAKHERQLLIIHTIGSHWNYSYRFNPLKSNFTPICTDNAPMLCDRESLLNSYDNSIAATDEFLSDIISRLNSRNAILIYSSDHGESLGENGYYVHAQKKFIPEQRLVPLFFWSSPKYKDLNNKKIINLKSNTNKKATHDNIFHSILDCSGIQSEIIDLKLSLCSSI